MNKTLEEIALERIQEAAESGAETLDLKQLELQRLPDALWELTHIKELDLQDNELTEIPAHIARLTNLVSLDLSNNYYSFLVHQPRNKLTHLPNELWELPSLRELDISHNAFESLPAELLGKKDWESLGLSGVILASLPPEISQLQNLTSLDISHNQLASLPPETIQLQNLTQLDLSGNQFTSLPPETIQLQNLTQLDLSGNQLTSLPPEITQLQNLTGLYLSGNQLANLPPEIAQLQNLIELSLSGNQLANLPPEIAQLQNLIELSLSSNQFASLPPEIAQLQNLTGLYLSGNQLANLPPEIAQLQNLTQLDLSDNQLASLPPEIAQLQNLKELYLWSNQLVSLPPEIIQLQNLTSLYLFGNQLTSLPPEIAQLQNLTSLSISGNQLTSLPPEIAQLQNLTSLSISGNQLTSLPPEIAQLRNLTELHLSNNQLIELPKELAKLRRLQQINLNNNPLEIAMPAKWLEDRYRGSNFAQEILAYYQQMHAEGGRSLGEARVLVIGEADAGKTKLLRALLHGEYAGKFKDTRDATEGIEISEMQDADVNTRIWDFGGQEIMHATHRFFLSRRCVYVLVVDATRDRDHNQAKIEYWMELVKSYGGASPILLVASKSESFSLDINKNDLQEKYPNLVKGAVLATSAKSGKGIEELRSVIIEQAKKLPSVNVTLPRSFIAVKDKIEKLKDKKKSTVMEEDEYRKLCKKNNITDEERQSILLQLLHDMGVVLHYENDDRLSDFGILNPEWATAGVYKLVNSPKIKESQGKFTLGEVKDLLQDESAYPANMRRRIVDLMKKFELTYELPVSPDTYILPSALPANQPELKEWDGNTMAFEYQYSILRVSILHRFMVKKHELIQNEHIWYSGVVIANNENQALIKADFNKKRILIKVKGTEETRKDFLYLIRMEFESIHGEESKPDEFVYHPKYSDLPLPFNEMKILAKTDREHKTVYKKERIIINLRELLDGFVTAEERRKDEEMEKQEGKLKGRVPDIEKGGDTYITNINMGDVEGGNVTVGKANQITQNVENSFNTFPADLQSSLIELMKLTETMMKQVNDDAVKEEIKEELESLQSEAKKSKPKKERVKITVEGLKKAAQTLNEIGTPVISLASKILSLLGS